MASIHVTLILMIDCSVELLLLSMAYNILFEKIP
jgi:hypothetical protein